MTKTKSRNLRYTVVAKVCYGTGEYVSRHRTLVGAGRAIMELERRDVVIGFARLVDTANKHCTADATRACEAAGWTI